MGYTHYHMHKKEFTSEEWDKIVAEFRRINESMRNFVLAGWDGKNYPEVTGIRIRFNGRGEASHETFMLDREPAFGVSYWIDPVKEKKEGVYYCCKTAYKPYDAAVVTLLAFARDLAPDKIKVFSDGGDEAIRKEV